MKDASQSVPAFCHIQLCQPKASKYKMWSDRTKNSDVLGEKELEIKKSVDTNNNTIMYTVTIMKTFIEPYNIMWFRGRCIWMVGISPFSWKCMNIKFWIQYLNKHAAGNVCGRIQKKLFWFVRVLPTIWDSEYVLEGVLSDNFSKMVILTKTEQHAINTELQTGIAVRSSHANWAYRSVRSREVFFL